MKKQFFTPSFFSIKNTDTILLFLIVSTGVVLRFWNFSQLPFMYDELSALSRTDFLNFSELIDKGIRIDAHPAGIQVFLFYWIQLLGISEMGVKLPFLLCGIASIVVTYKISAQWFNSTVGLFSASFIASIQYMVMYSQIARPYVSGLFFSLSMVWCWSNYFFAEQKTKWIIGYVLFSALCAYNHHISLLFAIIVGITGLVFVRKNNWKLYLVSGLLIFVVYIPHLGIFFYQLNVGGIGGADGWLAKPEGNWILKYIKYVFHFSGWMYLLVFSFTIAGVFFRTAEIKQTNKYRIVCASWFATLFLIQYYYSVFVNAVLQFSTLIFVFPFLLILLFSFFRPMNNTIKTAGVLLILLVSTATLIFERKHYRIFFKQPCQEMVLDAYHYADKIKSDERITTVLSIPKYYKEYYFTKYQRALPVTPCDSFGEIPNPKAFRNFISLQKTDYITAGNLPPQYIQIIKEKFPYMIGKCEGFTYSTYCFSKKIPATEIKENVFVKELFPASAMDSSAEYSLTKKFNLQEIIHDRHSIINLKTSIYAADTTAAPVLVIEVANNQPAIWEGAAYLDYRNDTTHSNQVYLCRDFTSFDFAKYADAEVKIYIWNSNKKQIQTSEIEIEIMEGNHAIYGLYEPLD
jgi:hypothetical protein